MKIVVDNGSYHLKNMGDLSMLKVVVKRMSNLFPDAEIQVFTDVITNEFIQDSPQIFFEKKWYDDNSILVKLQRKISSLLVQHQYHFHKQVTRLIEEADVVVTAGGGYIGVDAFKGQAVSILELLELAAKAGKTTAIFGHGFGTSQDKQFCSKLQQLLPKLDLIALREQVTSLPLLQSLGVPENKILVTGDDAVELAYQNRKDELGDAIGVNVRVSNYSDIDHSGFDQIKAALAEASKILTAKLIPTPISLVDEESDVATAKALSLDEDGDGLDTPIKVIHQVGRCRVVVTGSYHAGVFALSQGIPVVALASSKYYQQKFLGLADQFGVGCKVILFSEHPNSLKQEVLNSIKDAWYKAEAVKSPLLESAQKQIQRGYLAYDKLAQLVVNR